MLFDIHSLCWNERLLEVLDIPMTMMPEVKPSSCIYGYTDPDVTGGTIAISGAAGDQQAALFGQCCFEEGDGQEYIWHGMLPANEHRASCR